MYPNMPVEGLQVIFNYTLPIYAARQAGINAYLRVANCLWKKWDCTGFGERNGHRWYWEQYSWRFLPDIGPPDKLRFDRSPDKFFCWLTPVRFNKDLARPVTWSLLDRMRNKNPLSLEITIVIFKPKSGVAHGNHVHP